MWLSFHFDRAFSIVELKCKLGVHETFWKILFVVWREQSHAFVLIPLSIMKAEDKLHQTTQDPFRNKNGRLTI